jgi:hypothetical protein
MVRFTHAVVATVAVVSVFDIEGRRISTGPKQDQDSEQPADLKGSTSEDNLDGEFRLLCEMAWNTEKSQIEKKETHELDEDFYYLYGLTDGFLSSHFKGTVLFDRLQKELTSLYNQDQSHGELHCAPKGGTAQTETALILAQDRFKRLGEFRKEVFEYIDVVVEIKEGMKRLDESQLGKPDSDLLGQFPIIIQGWGGGQVKSSQVKKIRGGGGQVTTGQPKELKAAYREAEKLRAEEQASKLGTKLFTPKLNQILGKLSSEVGLSDLNHYLKHDEHSNELLGKLHQLLKEVKKRESQEKQFW